MARSIRAGLHVLSDIWSTTSFESNEVLRYAMPRITAESQRGVAALSLAALAFLLAACFLSVAFELGTGYVYTYALLAALALHVYLSSWSMMQLSGLYLLAMALLVICGSALVLVAQQSGRLDLILLSSVAALFMLVPVVPWGLREALAVVLAIYFMFTASMLSTGPRFAGQDFWLLQFLMLFAALVSVALVIRALLLRKHDLRAQFDLYQAHNEMQELLNRDVLTGARNRRFLESHFTEIVAGHHRCGESSVFVLFDIDRFKQINDTYGHDTGDAVLKAVAHALSRQLEKDEYLIRMGGDEFALLLCGRSPERLLKLAYEQIADNASSTATYQPPGLSVGFIVIEPGSDLRLDQVYRLTDAAQYDAKRSGGGRIVERRPEDELPEPAGVAS